VLLTDIGLVHLDLGAPAKARAKLTEAVSILETLGDKVAQVEPLIGLGKVYLAEREFARAEAELDRALSICEESGCSAETTADRMFEAARILRDHGRSEQGAARLAEQALAVYRKLPAAADRVKAVEAWLQHSAP